MVNQEPQLRSLRGWADCLDSECAKIKADVSVIFTHYVPGIEGTSAVTKNNPSNSGLQATEMTVRSCCGHPASMWAFGHTHFNYESYDLCEGGVRGLIDNHPRYEGIDAFRSRFYD
jgi:hypothetical protein